MASNTVGVLDAHADEAVDVEEAAIRALVAGQPPPGEAVVLRLEQGVQPRRVGVERGDDRIEAVFARSAPPAPRARRRARPAR